MFGKAIRLFAIAGVACSMILAMSALGEPFLTAPPGDAVSAKGKKRHFVFDKKIGIMLARDVESFPTEDVLKRSIANGWTFAKYSRKEHVIEKNKKYYRVISQPEVEWPILRTELKVLPSYKIKDYPTGEKKAEITKRGRLFIVMTAQRPAERLVEIQPVNEQADEQNQRERVGAQPPKDPGDEELSITIDEDGSGGSGAIEVNVDVEPYPEEYNPCN